MGRAQEQSIEECIGNRSNQATAEGNRHTRLLERGFQQLALMMRHQRIAVAVAYQERRGMLGYAGNRGGAG
jgi:hypothetical protein